MNKKNILFAIIGLLIGLIIGFFVANTINKNAVNNQIAAQNPSAPITNPDNEPQMQGQPPTGGMLADVQKTIDKAKNEPENFEAQIEAGKMYAQIQKMDEALAFFQKAQQIKPDDFDANVFLGNAFYDAGQFENAETYYQKALQIKPDDVTVQSDFATTFLQLKSPDYQRALKEFDKALKLNPKHEPTLYNMALTYQRMNDKENAQKTLERLKSANPGSTLIPKLEQALTAN